MISQFELEETIEPGLRYTEETTRLVRNLPMRDCFLWRAGVAEPISGINVLAFRQRFGALSIAAEGIGGVETIPAFRRQGYVSKLMLKALEHMAKRVPVAFLSHAIDDLYEKFGFVSCLAQARLSVQVRNIEQLANYNLEASSAQMRSFSQADLPAMVALYNQVHAKRPWTHERHAAWDGLLATQTWHPGSEVIIHERDQRVAGYAILDEPQYGQHVTTLAIDELSACDIGAAQALLIELARRCWQMRISEFLVREPLDSLIGKAAQRFGCEYHQTFPRSGGMMGAILDRQQLLLALEPELRRRLPHSDLHLVHAAAFDALCRGEIIPDNRDLLRLLIGYWSISDVDPYNTSILAEYQHITEAWFPGGGSQLLPIPYAHKLDRY